MNPRDDKQDLIGYTFNLEELVVIKAALENSNVKAFIQTVRTNMITDHLMTPLLQVQAKGPNFKLNMALEEAYLKGALDFAATLLDSVQLPQEKVNASSS